MIRLDGLKRGEYGFLPPGVSSASIAASGKMYTFGVIESERTTTTGNFSKGYGASAQERSAVSTPGVVAATREDAGIEILEIQPGSVAGLAGCTWATLSILWTASQSRRLRNLRLNYQTDRRERRSASDACSEPLLWAICHKKGYWSSRRGERQPHPKPGTTLVISRAAGETCKGFRGSEDFCWAQRE